MTKNFLFALLISITAVGISAQPAGSIRVKLLDERSGAPVEMAHVFLSSAKDSTYTVSGRDGIAYFPKAVDGRVRISHVSYFPHSFPVRTGVNAVYLTPRSNELTEVVVTGQVGPTITRESVRKIKVINRQRIDQQAAVNLRELLSNDLNFRFNEDLILGSQVSFQGLSSQQLKILVDGVPVIGRLNGNIDLSQINLNDIERVEIVEGPMSVEYGTDAMAGTINLITRRNYHGKTKLQLNSYYETVGRYNIDGSIMIPAGKTNISLSGGRNFFDGYDPDAGKRNLTWNPKEQYFFSPSVQRRFGKLLLRYRADLFREKIVNRGEASLQDAILEPLPDSGAVLYPRGLDDYYHTYRINNALYGDYYFDQHMKLESFLSYNYYRRKKTSYQKNLTSGEEILRPGAQDTSIFDLLNSRLTFSQRALPQRLSYQTGWDIKYENSRGERIAGEVKSIADIAFFTSVEYLPFKKLTIQPGLRYAYNSRFKAPLISSLALRYQPDSAWILRASFGQGYRAPSLKELYFDFVDENHVILGNTGLRAERSENYQISLTYDKSSLDWQWQFSAGAFFNNVHDQIRLAMVVQPDSNDSRGEFRNANVARAQTAGVSADLQLTWMQWSVNAGVTYQGEKNAIAFENPAGDFFFYPQLRLNLGYEFVKYGLSASLFCNYTGVRPQLKEGTNEEGTLDINYFSDYSITDFTLQKKLWKDRLMLGVGVKNIFDVTSLNSTLASSNGAHSVGTTSQPLSYGRTLFTSLRLNF